jgi:pimeloyl-ACP methyl ester carboxylesterase
MGCAEIVRYLTRHGSSKVAGIVLTGSTTPVVCRSANNPDGVDPALYEFFRKEQLMKDYPRWIDENMEAFVPGSNVGMQNWLRQMALTSTALALHDCNVSVTEADFTEELKTIKVPTLIIHGTIDVSCPLTTTAERTKELIAGSQLIVYEEAAHGFPVTHIEQFNADLLEFARHIQQRV